MDTKEQARTYIVSGSEEPGFSAIMRHPERPAEDVMHTMYEVLEQLATRMPNAPFLGTRPVDTRQQEPGPYEWQSFASVKDTVDEFGTGLDLIFAKLGLDGPQPVGIYASGRAEWVVAELAAFRSARYSVGIYDSLDAEAAARLLDRVSAPVVVCAGDRVAALLAKQPAHLRVVIALGAVRAGCGAVGVEIMHFDDVIMAGRIQPTRPRPAPVDSLCTISFSAGTTGPMKGIEATHENVVGAARALGGALRLANAIYLSHFSMACAFERSVVYACMLAGARIGFSAGDVWRLAEDAQALRPTLLAGVPRLLCLMHRQIAAATVDAPGLAGTIARTAVRRKQQKLKERGGSRHALWDRVACARMAQLFGGRVTLLVTGGGAVDAGVLAFLRVAFSCPVVETYGLVETCGAAAACAVSDRWPAGHVGAPLPGIDVRLRALPALGLSVETTTPCGELLVRGASVCHSYLCDAARSRVTFADGWVRTGDVARLNRDGHLEIIGRVCAISTRSAPPPAPPLPLPLEMVEASYARHALVRDIFIHCDGASLIAVVVPAPEFEPLARRITRCPHAPVDALLQHDLARRAMLMVLHQHARNSAMRSHEHIVDVACHPVPFDALGTRLLTPTFKLRRRDAAQYFAPLISDMRSRPPPIY
ncbi:medium-chain fatty acid-CoA ligase faa2 [Coemansia sp. RSA 1250]|nr:medium-chain fatty acid-CoA ligase faa2 [Coemansia sp. RSA 1250]